eukprot:1437664-Rhodomonas_salina.5
MAGILAHLQFDVAVLCHAAASDSFLSILAFRFRMAADCDNSFRRRRQLTGEMAMSAGALRA